jgi:hypothetical protein
MGVIAAVGLGSVVVYKNQFGHRGTFNEIKKKGGKACERNFSKQRKQFVAIAKKAPKHCPFRTPVVGDAPRPDHTITIRAKVSKNTPKGLRKTAFVGAALRVSGKEGYELRVFPKRGRFELHRKPNGGGFPAEGQSNAIRGIGKTNKLRLAASGAQVKASVNGRQLAAVTDSDPGRVSGRRVEFLLGSRGDSGRETKGAFDTLRIAVPDP